MNKIPASAAALIAGILIASGPRLMHSQEPRPAAPNRQLQAEQNFREPAFFPQDQTPR